MNPNGKFAATILVCVGWLVPLTASAADEEGWRFAFGPYLWASALDGDVTVKGIESEVDASFSDIFDNLDRAFITHFEAQKGRYGVLVDFIYLGIKVKGDAPPLVNDAKIKMDSYFVEVAGLMQVNEQWQLLAGVRYVDLSVDMDFTGPLGGDFETSGGESWADPFVGLRVQIPLSERWLLSARADIGGFGIESEFTWNASLLFAYQFGEKRRWSTYMGYRALDIDYETGSGPDELRYDVLTSGPVLGFQRRVGAGW